MITTKQLLGASALALAAFVSSSSAFAQDSETAGSGLIGKRYAGADLNIINYRENGDDGYGGDLGVNVPVSDTLDLQFGYDYSMRDFTRGGVDSETTAHTLGGSGVLYTQVDNYKPYMTAGLGFQFSETEIGGLSDDNDSFLYHIGLGVEVEVADKTSVSGEVRYQDATESGSDDQIVIEVGANHWLTDKVALRASVAIYDEDAVAFSLGARFAF